MPIPQAEHDSVVAEIMADSLAQSSSDNDFAPVPVWLGRRSEVTDLDKLVYATIRRYQSMNNFYAYCSTGTIAEETGKTKTSVLRSLRRLKEHGLIGRRERQRKDKTPLTSILWTRDHPQWMREYTQKKSERHVEEGDLPTDTPYVPTDTPPVRRETVIRRGLKEEVQSSSIPPTKVVREESQGGMLDTTRNESESPKSKASVEKVIEHFTELSGSDSHFRKLDQSDRERTVYCIKEWLECEELPNVLAQIEFYFEQSKLRPDYDAPLSIAQAYLWYCQPVFAGRAMYSPTIQDTLQDERSDDV